MVRVIGRGDAGHVGGLAVAGLMSRPEASDFATVVGNEIASDRTPSALLKARLGSTFVLIVLGGFSLPSMG